MYRSIYVPVDNSAHALRAVDVGIAIARGQGARLTGSHVYAAALHERRFRQMESGLPGRYLKEETLLEQRGIHGDLIARGLGVISDSYLDVFSRKCGEAGIPGHRVSLEGKNWQRLVEDVRASGHDLVIMGAVGLGAVDVSVLGSVCERMARRVACDLLVVKTASPDRPGAIVVGIDGSPRSYGGLETALELGRLFGRPVEAVSAFDPFFHYAAFQGIARVLSPAAAGVFRFEEQERLHGEIIDGGLAKIYQAYLDVAAAMAAAEGMTIRTTLLAGKPFAQILEYVRKREPWLLVLGRTGLHSDDGMDLGSTAENLLRLADCHVLLSAQTCEPPLERVAETTLAWTEEAAARMERVPAFARALATGTVIRYAVERGHTVITSDVIDACLASIARGSAGDAAAKAARDCPYRHAGNGAASGAPGAAGGEGEDGGPRR